MKKAFLFLSVFVCVAASASAGWRTYQQTVEVTFDTPEAAAQAQLTALPLPPGKRLAFSSRWDDTNKDHVRLTFRVPPKWKTGVAAHGFPALKAGAEQRCEIDLGERENGAGYDNGPLYFAVQCDLTDAQGAARVYGTTEVSAAAASK